MEHQLPHFAKGKVKLPIIGSTRKELIPNLSPELYHGTSDAISSSGIRKILRSPRHFLAWLSGLEDDDSDKDHFRFGRAAHLALLEPWKFVELYVMQPDFGDMRSSKNRDQRDEWRAKQSPEAMILKNDEFDILIGMVEAIKEHPIARGLLENGQAEMSGFVSDPETGILCRVRPDFLARDKQGNLVLIDFKTSRDVRPGMFSESAYKYGYDTQLAFYNDMIQAIMGEQIFSVALISVEKTIPFDCCVYICNDDMIQKGREKYKHALRLLKKSLTLGEWPGTQKYAQELALPTRSNFDIPVEFNYSGGERNE